MRSQARAPSAPPRATVFAEVQRRVSSPQKLAAMFSTCIRCHNCMTNCPICYCKTCFFKTNVFDHEPMQFLAWAERKGATRVPADTMLFHLTRLNHMSTSLCGLRALHQCVSGWHPRSVRPSAPSPPRRRLSLTTWRVRSVDDPIPVKNFEVNELQQLGEH